MLHNTLSIKKEIGIHILFWLIWIYFNMTTINNNGFMLMEMNLFSWTWCIVYMTVFYFNYLIALPWVFKSFKWYKPFLGTVGIFLFFVGLRYFIEQFLTVLLFDTQNYLPHTNRVYYLYDNLFFGSQPIILSTVFWVIIFLIRVLEQNKAILEENKNTEIKFLKAQINPHFVFNTLNNIYSMVYFQSDKSLPAIEKLSQIMRFTTYQSQKEIIKLTDEINYIKAYIELEQLRHVENSFVNLDIHIEQDLIDIPPYILSPLVENALKHGVASSQYPIKIKLVLDSNSLIFTVQNVIGTQKKDKLGGIGLDNLRRRLDIYYRGRYLLHINNSDKQFTVRLQIDLK